MVAVIKTGHSVRGIVRYNENKVKTGAAQCIGQGSYPMEAARMNESMKLNRLLYQTALNDNVKRAAVHISLNFHPSEQYPREKLLEIAASYMEQIGFGEQPYLVYQHYDAGHPHLHLVSIKIRADGSRIDMQNIGRNQSEKARRAIEKSFNLVQADGRGSQEAWMPIPVVISKVSYGRMESKKAISSVLHSVLTSYSYRSLSELNAVLGLYHIKADRGSADSRIFASGGLVYRILDQDQKPAGVPIKASDFSMRPTLAFLEKKFASNNTERALEKKRIRNAVDTILLRGSPALETLITGLRAKGIDTVLRQSDSGMLYGITFVDHSTKCVFNGSALGRNYSAKAIVERCAAAVGKKPLLPVMKRLEAGVVQNEKQPAESWNQGLISKAAEDLLQPVFQADYTAANLKPRRKKRKRKGRGESR